MVVVTPLYVLFALLGLALGSFGNVLIARIRTAESFGGRSHCPHCKKTIAWFDLFPLLSFAVLGGRCRACKKSISVQYPLVECGSMLVFLLGLSLSPLDPVRGLSTAFALYFLLLACAYDGIYQQIPDAFTAAFTLAVFVNLALAGDFTMILPHLLGALLGASWFGLQWALSRRKAVGTGDIFLSAAIGLWLGVSHAVTMLILSYMLGAIIVMLLIAGKRIVFTFKDERIAFGPFMGAATVLTLLGAGEAYLSLLH